MGRDRGERCNDGFMVDVLMSADCKTVDKTLIVAERKSPPSDALYTLQRRVPTPCHGGVFFIGISHLILRSLAMVAYYDARVNGRPARNDVSLSKTPIPFR